MRLRFIYRSFVFFILLALVIRTSAVSILLDDSKGISNNIITEITQDQKGLLWVGTHSGLNTYDGYSFREIPAFKSVHINCVRYDKWRNCVWIGTEYGLYYINLNTSDIIDCTSKSSMKNAVELALYNGTVFVAFQSGNVLQIARNNSSKVIFNVKKLNKASMLYKGRMVVDSANVYLAPTKYNHLVSIALPASPLAKSEGIQMDAIRNIGCYDSLFIINTEHKGISVFNTSTQQHLFNESIDKLNKTNNSPEFAYYKNNKLYLAYKGLYWLYVIDLKTGEVSKFSTEEDREIFRTKVINCMYEDNTGVLWVGTSKGLIKIFESHRLPFTPVLTNGMYPVSIRQIVSGEPGRLYISTYNGIYNYGINTGEVKTLERPEPIGNNDYPNYYRALLYDSAGYLYTGTESHEYFFFRYNIRRKQFEKNFYVPENPLSQIGASYSLLKDKHGIIWIATDKGLASFNTHTQKLKLHKSGKFHTGNNTIMFLSQSAQQNYFWAGGKNGLFFVHIINGIEEHLSTGSQPALPDDEIIFVSEDPEQHIWIGYKKSGIRILDRHLKTITTITKSNGLSSNEVYGILWQGKDTAWISTLNGLCCYSVKAKTFNNYFVENGLPDNEFNQNSFYAGGNNQFYFGGVNGIVRFSPPVIPQSPPVSLFVSSVSKWDKNTQSFTNVSFNDSAGSLVMTPSDHLLTFTMGLSDYSNTEGNSYFYRIKGLYNEWIAMGNQNILRLEGLPAGTFTIQIIAFNKKGMQSSNTLNYQINIMQVFYRTWWFFFALLVGMALLIILYFRWRLQNIQRMQKLRTQIASNLHDEVGSLLTSIIMSTDSARYSSNSIEEKNAKLEKVATLSRNATNTMSDVLWSIDSRNDYAGNLTDRMREHAESMLLPLDIDLEFDFTETRQEQNIKPDTRQNLYLIFKEAVNNIVKHSKATSVNVLYKQLGNQFEMIITNNNPIGDTSVHQGQGLKNMQMRAKKINATLRYDITENRVTVHVKSK